ncbi:MAG: preprotein translocase subunit SecG [Armatimonadetes bacterium]|nr:preprotein translocase subunit SecG [Armatimonadota bacterium]CUU37986.1 preprotein translocase subunit SecG [Armatimonadetes bacterium DC]
MEILKQVLTWIDIAIMIVFIFLVAIQTSRSEGVFSPGGGDSMYARAKPGFEDQISRLTLILAIAFFVLTAVVTYMP